ncbi:MAG: hypothetical protein Kow0074_03780 [Candidatus Zixiibacteriota bacterium]
MTLIRGPTGDGLIVTVSMIPVMQGRKEGIYEMGEKGTAFDRSRMVYRPVVGNDSCTRIGAIT